MKFAEKRDIYIATAISSGISLISSSIVIYIYISQSKFRSFSFKIICHLLFYDILHSIVFMIPTYNLKGKDFLCGLQSFFISVVTQLCVIWTFIIGLCLYLSLSKWQNRLEGYLKWFLVFNWVVSLTLGLIPYIEGEYGDDIGWCWIQTDSFYYRFIGFYIPLWLVIFSNCCFYIAVIIKIKKTIKNIEQNQKLTKLINKLKIYPIANVISFLPITIYRIYEYIYGQDYYFIIISGVFLCSQGFINSITYGLNKKIKDLIRKKLARNEIKLSEFSEEYKNEIYF
jgi:7 transmembrane receptor (Secretin family)